MKRIIDLATGLYDEKSYTLTDNDVLEIELKGKTYPGIDYYAKLNHNGKIINLLFVDKKITLSDLTYGTLSLVIIAKKQDTTIKEFKCEDLILKELDGKLEALSQVEELKSKIKELENKIVSCETLCEKTRTLVIELNGLKEIIK